MGSRVFNFYQSSGNYGTGLYRPTNPIDFFTGVYLPEGIVLGVDVGFLWPASDRTIHQGVSLSGQVAPGNRQAASISSQVWGTILPILKESGILSVSTFSGTVNTNSPDRISLIYSLTGQISSAEVDKPKLVSNFNSGEVSAGNTDRLNYSAKISGAMKSAEIERIPVSFSFRGGFAPKDIDTVGISFNLSSITYGDEANATYIKYNTGIALQMRLTTIVYENAS